VQYRICYPRWGNDLGCLPLYELEGLKPNDHSGPAVAGSQDGSYNLASTLIKGKGRGVVAPAVTVKHTHAVNAIAEAITILHAIAWKILKKALLKEEFEAF
jgi:hypothetical protein